MPIPQRKENESKKDFISRCMGDSVMVDEYKNPSQRYAICLNESKGGILEDACYYLDDEELTISNLIIPSESDYVDFGEEIEILNLQNYFENSKSAEYQGRKVTLNKPFRTPDGPKKFAVYTKNQKGKVVVVRFGDKNMKIKKNIPERRKSFRARHGCDKNPGPKWKAKYWSCQWSW
jgi:hypothetical protein